MLRCPRCKLVLQHLVEARLQKLNLTPAQFATSRLLFDGMTNKQIASTLGISEGTVKNRLMRIYEAVGASDRLELVTMVLFGEGA